MRTMSLRYFTDTGIEVPAVTTEPMIEVDRVTMVAAAHISGHPRPDRMNQGAAEIRATASSVVQTALAIKRKLIKAAK